ncbi:MAG: CHASE2 domain-containing protein [Magnetococcales bacterium]|nr:CHASE2 domain-containing protein [Magnetococcales bacterium]
MNKITERWDILGTVILFLLAIPAEYYEIFSFLEEQTISFRQILRVGYGDPEQTRFSKDKIVLVNTDEEFFKEYKSFPLRRTDIGKIAENLKFLGAKVVAVDFLMDFPSSYGEDQPAAESFKKASPVLLVAQADIVDGEFHRMNHANETLAAVTEDGYTNITSSSSLVTSLSRLHVNPEIAALANDWPYAVKALAMYYDVEPTLEGETLKFGDILTIPLDQNHNFYIDFPALPNGTKFLSESAGLSAMEFIDISDLDADEIEELRYWIKDKLVLIGDTSEVSHDWFDTPVGMVYGVEIIASAIDTMMKGGKLRPVSEPSEVVVSIIFMIALIFLGLVSHPTIRALVALVLFAGWIAFVSFVYVKTGMVYSMAYLMVAGVLSFIMINMRYYLKEMGQKTMIKGAFGQYLSPAVVEILVNDPSKLSLGGEQREMTAFFSDVAGFSSISEKLTPQELVQLLNEYLTAMCDIIAKYDGTVDKFEGDAIIAFWGAPLPHEDHAVRCCHAAIDMEKHMVNLRVKLKAEGRPNMTVRMGINSGLMVVGNMGSATRMDYTIMGDAVNLAARLEGANKFYSSGTMISDSTYRLAKDHIDARELDTVRVIGKKEPITIYQLLDKKGQVSGVMADLLVHYYKGRDEYKARKYAEAVPHFEKALELIADDGPSLTYLERCKEYMENPPPDDWDGVFNFTSKG